MWVQVPPSALISNPLRAGFLLLMQTKRLLKTFWQILKPVLILGLLASFFIFVPLVDILHVLQTANVSLFFLSLLLSIPIIYFAAVTLKILAGKQEIHYSIWDLIKLNLVIRFYAFFSPASIVGSSMRWYKLASGGKEAEALSALSVDRALDVITAVLLGLFWFLSGVHQQAFNPAALVLLLALIILGWLVLTHWSPQLAQGAHWLGDRVHYSWLNYLIRFFARFLQSMSAYASLSAMELVILGGSSILSELFNLLIQVMLALALHIPISISDLGWMRSLFFLASLAPFTLTGGIGLREVTTVVVMAAFGIPADMAGAFALLSYARSALFSSFGGFFELWEYIRSHFSGLS